MTSLPAEQQANDVEELQAEISATLRDLDALTTDLLRLVDTHQRRLGFLTPQARQRQDDAIRAERTARRGHPRRPELGHTWLNSTITDAATGDVPVPVTIAAASVDAEITFTLHHLVRRIVTALARAGVATMHRLPADPTYSVLLGHLRKLAMAAPSPTLLAEVLRELETCRDAAEQIVDGDDQAQLEDPCPHCGLRTLVVSFKDGQIRCGRDPRTGHYAPCRCPDAYCDCKRKPVTHRHTWWRDRGTSADGWWALSDRLQLHRNINQKDVSP